ncbi:hypothetical protein QLY92_07580 [Cronobacter dublinensis]|uniref:hypothetical protein n=1 Tax=Cronobacter dublinensis TaxID=413497 RepID=UPI0024AEC328|nr:hypothetical protein [Cronobacter dublinensis]MDI7491955.1 hypothetical protein [Cronobacter dublinensis]
MRASLLTSLPCMMDEPTAFSWLCLQESLLKAPNTVEAYARGVDDWLHFCHQNDVSPTEPAGRFWLCMFGILMLPVILRLQVFVIASQLFGCIVTICGKKG